MTAFLISGGVLIAAFMILGSTGFRRIGSETEYSMAGRKAGTSQVIGIFMGALTGGAVTVGTAEMAYQYGLSALWFCFGGGISCLVLGVWLARPLRRSGLSTIPQYMDRCYGRPVSMLSLASTAAGTLISVIVQFLAGIPLLQSLYPFSVAQSAILFGAMILAFIFLGGINSFSTIGTAKTTFLYVIMISCVAVGWSQGHTIKAVFRDLPFEPFLNPMAGGFWPNFSSLVSIFVGIICTQIFVQGIFSAQDEETARKGVLVTSFVIPTMGFLAVLVGMNLKHSGVVIEASQALPYVIRTYFHPVIGGAFWAGILVAIVGSASGLILGMATNMITDLTVRAFPFLGEKTLLLLSRSSVVAIVITGALSATLAKDTLILRWSYLSFGLRGAVTFFPFIFAILFPGRLSPFWGLASSAGGLLALFFVPISGIPADTTLLALAVSGLLAMAGYRRKYRS